jgi:hypothetical protein
MNPAALAAKLKDRFSEASSLPVVAGFDAFVDEVIHVVGTRISPENYTPVSTIKEFGNWALTSAGRSGLREVVTLYRSPGGCTVNSGDGLATLGFPIDAFAGVGTPPDGVFEEFCAKCRSVHSLGMEPGRTMVHEFQDGKLMFCSFSHFAQFTPEYLAGALADGNYLKACQQAAGIMLTSWSVYPHMTQCWKFLQKEIFSGLVHRPRFFLDLADPASRDPKELAGMMDALAGFESIGPTTLSLNGNEANQIARALGLAEASQDSNGVERLARELRERAQISEMGIHLIKSAAAATVEGSAMVHGPFCANPRKSVGAGDRFNAGWLAGGLLGLSLEDRLLLGVAASGFFVRAARSGNFSEIFDFLQNWSNGSLDQ